MSTSGAYSQFKLFPATGSLQGVLPLTDQEVPYLLKLHVSKFNYMLQADRKYALLKEKLLGLVQEISGPMAYKSDEMI